MSQAMDLIGILTNAIPNTTQKEAAVKDEERISLPIHPQQSDVHGAAANLMVYAAVRDQLITLLRKTNLNNLNELIQVAKSFENSDEIRSFITHMLSACADYHIRSEEAFDEHKLTHV